MHQTAIRILAANTGKSHIFFLGQAGFIFKSQKGTLLGVDLYLSHCVERVEGHVGYKRLLPVLLAPDEVQFDFLVATHPHFDHFDMDAIPTLMSNSHTRLFASVHCEAEVRRLMMTNDRITYVKPGDQAQAADFRLQFVPCDHGAGAPDAVGLIVTMDGKRIYIAGDTCLHPEQACTLGNIDVMIAPINGAYGNLNEKECCALANAVKPGLTIPCHYGMFASHGGNPGVFMTCMEEAHRPFLLMAAGEQYTLGEE